jgi:hypothetical protein
MLEGWKETLKTQIETVVNVRKRPFEKYKDAPMLVNTVSTVSILPQGYRLPLQTITNALGPCCQFEPSQFAAAIIKDINSTSDATALVFSSGKLVLTATTTRLHTMYMAHVFRLKIEHIECVMKDEKTNQLHMDTFSGRTVFENLKAHNMVGHGDLGVRVDLRSLRNANPDSVKWLPDGFPAAKCCVWLTEDNMCHCGPQVSLDPDVLQVVPKLLRKRCACTIKCLVFPTGRVVMTGGRSMKDINSVFYRMKALAPHFAVGNMIDIFVPRDSASSSSNKKKDVVALTQDESVALLLQVIYDFKPKRIKKKAVNSSNILLTFAEHGRLSNLRDTLLMLQTEEGDEIESVNEAITKLTTMERTIEQTNNLNYLKQYLEQHNNVVSGL